MHRSSPLLVAQITRPLRSTSTPPDAHLSAPSSSIPSLTKALDQLGLSATTPQTPLRQNKAARGPLSPPPSENRLDTPVVVRSYSTSMGSTTAQEVATLKERFSGRIIKFEGADTSEIGGFLGLVGGRELGAQFRENLTAWKALTESEKGKTLVLALKGYLAEAGSSKDEIRTEGAEYWIETLSKSVRPTLLVQFFFVELTSPSI